jgi:hypothetical protein
MPSSEMCSLQPSAYAGFSLAHLSILKMEAIRSSETSVHTRSTRRHIPGGGILYSHRCENLKSYIKLKLSLCVIKTPTHEDVLGSGGID